MKLTTAAQSPADRIAELISKDPEALRKNKIATRQIIRRDVRTLDQLWQDYQNSKQHSQQDSQALNLRASAAALPPQEEPVSEPAFATQAYR